MSSTPPHEGLSRRERERLRRRQAMLRAAQSVFAEKGFARATLDEIAERAEFGKGTLYNYFEGGKEDLLFAVFDDLYDDVHVMLREAIAEPAPRQHPLRERFRTLVVEAFSFFLEREDLFMVLMKESYRLGFSENPEHAAYFQRQQERMVTALAPALEAAMERGEIQDLPAKGVAHMILENINGMLVHRAMMDRHEECAESILHDPEHAADFLTTILFDGLVHPSSAAASSTLSVHES
ncbi:MAG: TetR family transcriptional regulator [Bacteroidetes bacterium]|jgi:AcrR family transcriptional regulator|nr:TetR family transcriptional regulator [Bacteroidota bacterium]